MTSILAEFIGTAILILLGNGVVANVVLNHTKGKDSGWIVITFGWGIAVFTAVFIAGSFSGAHINPAVTLGLAMTAKFDWNMVPSYIIAQMLGAFFGSFLVFVHYHQHFEKTNDKDLKLAVFCTGPAIRHYLNNFLSEVIGTFILVFGVFFLVQGEGLGSLSSLPVGLLVLGIGLSLGGSTGYAINPARDLAPRIFHAFAPIKSGKRDSDWSYSWIPVLGPFTGAALAAFAYNLILEGM